MNWALFFLFSVFGDLFETAVQNGLAAIQTQHLGLYFQSAAQQVVQRKDAVLKIQQNLAEMTYPQPDPLEAAGRIGKEWTVNNSWWGRGGGGGGGPPPPPPPAFFASPSPFHPPFCGFCVFFGFFYFVV